MNLNSAAFDADLETTQSHDTAVRTYVTGFLYAESRSLATTHDDEPAQPVDEPAPACAPRNGSSGHAASWQVRAKPARRSKRVGRRAAPSHLRESPAGR